MSQFLKGKVALVTGGTKPVGAAVARALAREGASVAITLAGTEAKVAAANAALASEGINGRAYKCDPVDPKQAVALVQMVLETFGALDILVNASSVVWHGKTVDDPTISNVAMDQQWQLNVHNVIGVIRAASPCLRSGGRIITVGAALGQRAGFAGAADYVGTKAAIRGYTTGVARDLASRQITANIVSAGVTEDEFSVGRHVVIHPNQLETKSVKRVTTLEEIVHGVLYLAHPLSASVTGTDLDLSGGYLA